jgi:hypothetical protein
LLLAEIKHVLDVLHRQTFQAKLSGEEGSGSHHCETAVIEPSCLRRKGLIDRKLIQRDPLHSILQRCFWRPDALNWLSVSISFTLIGALGFLIGSLLMLAE